MDPRTAPAAPARAGQVPGPRRGGRRGPRPVPVRSTLYGHLTLPALREYRGALQSEEGKVSYWRRILQARLDLVRAGAAAPSEDGADLRPVLTADRVRSGRTALVDVLPVDDIPPLPALGELWERRVPASDLDGVAALERDLERAEEELSSYRRALHERLAGATDELIARYREEPGLCLTALPLRSVRGGV